jgi:NAD(P)-dependent dehydrogenase (short-subunit alcohol dehydrogenase family)
MNEGEGYPGIGREFRDRTGCVPWLGQGGRSVIADIAEERWHDRVGRIEDAGGEIHCAGRDVSKAHHVDAMVEQIVQKHGRLGCMLNNAGVESRECSYAAGHPLVADGGVVAQ